MERDRAVLILAIAVLLIGSFSTLYVHGTTKADANAIDINGSSYSLEYIFSTVKHRTIETDDGNFSGVALDDLIKKSGVACGSCHTYTIIGEDGYSKTVTWKNLQHGILMEDRKVVFSDLPKAFRVRDVVSIEVS